MKKMYSAYKMNIFHKIVNVAHLHDKIFMKFIKGPIIVHLYRRLWFILTKKKKRVLDKSFFFVIKYTNMIKQRHFDFC